MPIHPVEPPGRPPAQPPPRPIPPSMRPFKLSTIRKVVHVALFCFAVPLGLQLLAVALMLFFTIVAELLGAPTYGKEPRGDGDMQIYLAMLLEGIGIVLVLILARLCGMIEDEEPR